MSLNIASKPASTEAIRSPIQVCRLLVMIRLTPLMVSTYRIPLNLVVFTAYYSYHERSIALLTYSLFTIGIQWDFIVRSEYGDPTQGGSVGPWSAPISATARRNTPPPPNDNRSSPTSDGLQVTWGSVNGSFNIQEFAVIIWDRDTYV